MAETEGAVGGVLLAEDVFAEEAARFGAIGAVIECFGFLHGAGGEVGTLDVGHGGEGE